MYAILQQGGHQYRVAPGDRLLVDRLEAEVGTVVALEPVLLVHDGESATVGVPVVDGARVAALVVSHPKGKKIRVFTYKAKKRSRRTLGHRSLLTELRIHSLLVAGEDVPTGRTAAAETPPRGSARTSPTARGRAAAAGTTEPTGRGAATGATAAKATAAKSPAAKAPAAKAPATKAPATKGSAQPSDSAETAKAAATTPVTDTED